MTRDFAVDSDHVARAGRVALLGTGPLLLLSLVIVVALALAGAPEKHHGSVLDWVRGAIWLAGLAWHGTLAATVRGNAGTSESLASGTYEATAYATLAPLLLTFLTLALLAWAARKDERQRPSTGLGQLATRSLATSAFLGLAWFLLSGASRSSNGFGLKLSEYLGAGSSAHVRIGVGLGAVPTATTVLFLSLAVILAVRLATSPGRLHTNARLGSWLSAFSSALRLSVAVAVATTFVTVTYLLVQLIQAIGEDTSALSGVTSDATPDGAGPLVTIGLGLLTLPNLLITGSGFSLGSDLAASGDGSVSGSLPSLLGMSDLPFTTASYGLFTDSERPTWLYILLLTSLIAALAAGVRSIVRTQPAPLRLSTTAQWAVAFAVLWAVLGWLASVSFGVSGRAAGDVTSRVEQGIGVMSWDGSAGLSYTGIIGLATLWAAVACVAAHWLTPRLGGSAPRTIAGIGGLVDRRLHPSWALMLADASVRLGKDLPSWLRSAADDAAAKGYVAEQLPLHPGAARRIVLVGGTATLLIAVAVVGGSILESTTYGPAAAAKTYLDDVASGNAQGAMEQADLTSGNGDLLTDGVLQAQQKESPMTAVQVVSTKTSDKSSTVEVTYKVNGVAQSATLSLIQDDTRSRWGGLFHSWTVRDPFAQVTVSGSGGPIQIGGRTVTAGTIYRVFPGVVTATTPATQLLDADSDSQVVTIGSSTELSLNPDLRQNVINDVRAQMVTELTQCLKQDVLVPIGCPFSSSDYLSGRAVGVNWQAVSDIGNAITVSNSEGTLSTSGELPLSVTYTDVSDYSTSAESDSVMADLSATITYDGQDSISIQWVSITSSEEADVS
jgi:hypothetical protein